MIDFIMIYTLFANVAGFLLMGEDKRRAKRGEFRISEMKLILLALFGGSIGVLAGMYAFSHKTLHKLFSVGVPVILIVQTVAVMALVVYSNM